MEHLASAAQKVLFLLFISSLFGCGGLSIGSESSGDTENNSSVESQEISGENAQVNQPETNTVAGGGVNVDASNRPDNSVSDSEEILEAGVCEEPLWKPVSESTETLAIVGRVEDSIVWSSVSVEVAATGEIEYGEFSGFGEDGRQVWRFDLPGEDYTGDYTIEYSGESCSGSVEDPSKRSDAQSENSETEDAEQA